VAVGIACTAAFALLYAGLRNAASNGDLRRQLASYTLAYLLGLAASSAALTTLLALVGHPRGPLDTAAAVAAGFVATAVRFVLMRAWVFAEQPRTA